MRSSAGVKTLENLRQVSGDRDLAHRIGHLTVLDPKTRGAAAIIAGYQTDAHADEVGDEKAVGNIAEQLLGRLRAGPQMQIGWPGRRRRRHSAVRMAGRLQIEFARRRAIEQPGLQDAVIDNFEARCRRPLRRRTAANESRAAAADRR